MEESQSWHLSRSVPLALIVAILLQAGAIMYVAGQMQNTIDTNSSSIRENKGDIKNLEGTVHSNDVKLGRIQESILSVQRTLIRIEGKVNNELER